MTYEELRVLAVVATGRFHECTMDNRPGNGDVLTALWRRKLIVHCSIIGGKVTENGHGFGYMMSDKGKNLLTMFSAMADLLCPD